MCIRDSYYAGKAELFEAAVPPDLARRFEALLERRVKGLARVALGITPPGEGDSSEEMLRFWIEHRLEVVVLLDRAAGTSYAQYGERFVWLLVTTTLAQLRSERPGLKIAPPARFVLQRIFEGTRGILAAILVEHASERALREAIEAFWSYQIPGLRGFTQAVLAAHDRPRRSRPRQSGGMRTTRPVRRARVSADAGSRPPGVNTQSSGQRGRTLTRSAKPSVR